MSKSKRGQSKTRDSQAADRNGGENVHTTSDIDDDAGSHDMDDMIVV